MLLITLRRRKAASTTTTLPTDPTLIDVFLPMPMTPPTKHANQV